MNEVSTPLLNPYTPHDWYKPLAVCLQGRIYTASAQLPALLFQRMRRTLLAQSIVVYISR